MGPYYSTRVLCNSLGFLTSLRSVRNALGTTAGKRSGHQDPIDMELGGFSGHVKVHPAAGRSPWRGELLTSTGPRASSAEAGGASDVDELEVLWRLVGVDHEEDADAAGRGARYGDFAGA